jgi:hypothetical protein
VFEIVDFSVCVILIRKDGGSKAVFVSGSGILKKLPYVYINRESGFVIIEIKEDQTCIFYKNSLIKYFRYRSS